MALSRRLKILEALAKSSEANAEAMRLLLDGDSLPPPPNLEELSEPDEPSDKPTKPPGRPTRLVPAFTKERALEEVQKAWSEAKTEKDRAKVLETANRLVEQGLFSSEDIETLVKNLK